MQAHLPPSYIYLLLDAGALLFPFLLSFDKKVAFYRQWKYIFPAMALVALFFIVWDQWFTLRGVWAFDPKYIIGIKLGELPLEEVLFFVVVPYATVFIYEVIRAYFGDAVWQRAARVFWPILGIVLLILAAIFHTRLYTFVTFGLTGISLLVYSFVYKNGRQGVLLIAWLLQLLPFMVINGFLTALPVVSYNDAENLGLRLFTIPVEDSIYSLLLLLLNIMLLEVFRHRQANRKAARNIV